MKTVGVTHEEFLLAAGLTEATDLLACMTEHMKLNTDEEEDPTLICCYLFKYPLLTSTSRGHSITHYPLDAPD